MRFGLNVPGVYLYPGTMHPWEPQATVEDILRVVRKADELGYSFLSVPEHIIMGEKMLPAMGARWPHSVTAIAFFGGATRQIRLANSICVLPYHNPVELAKMYSTLDYLSGGRLIVGVGIGNFRKEFATLRVNHADRGPMADEYLGAMIELWTKERPVFKGRFVEFDGVVFEPKPAQKPYPPIWIGGNSKAALRRVARFGDGWWPSSTLKKDLPAALAYIREQPAFQQRPRNLDVIVPLFDTSMNVTTHSYNYLEPLTDNREALLDNVGRMKDLGVTASLITLTKSRSVGEYLEKLQRFAEDVFPAARD